MECIVYPATQLLYVYIRVCSLGMAAKISYFTKWGGGGIPGCMPWCLTNFSFYLRAVCDDHHFKDETLYYRFKNDEKVKNSLRVRDRHSSKSKAKHPAGEEDTGSTGDDHRESGGSWDDSSDHSHSHTPQRVTPELDE